MGLFSFSAICLLDDLDFFLLSLNKCLSLSISTSYFLTLTCCGISILIISLLPQVVFKPLVVEKNLYLLFLHLKFFRRYKYMYYRIEPCIDIPLIA